LGVMCSMDVETMARVHKEILEIFEKYKLYETDAIALLEMVKHLIFQDKWERFKQYEKELEMTNVYS